jgi:hypothetical protein
MSESGVFSKPVFDEFGRADLATDGQSVLELSFGPYGFSLQIHYGDSLGPLDKGELKALGESLIRFSGE